MKNLLLLLSIALFYNACAQTNSGGAKGGKSASTNKQSGVKKVNADTAIFLTNYNRFADAVKAAQATGKWLMLPATYNVTEKIEIRGNIKIGALGKCRLFDLTKKSEAGTCIMLYEGNHTFKNIEFIYPATSAVENYNAVQTAQSDITYHNYFFNCKFSGKWYNNYQSSMGHGISAFYNTRFFAESENIQYYSQSGSKTLILYNDTLETLLSHCVYSHPINNYDLYNVLVLGSGKLAWDSYGTSPTVTTGTNSFQRFRKCRLADTATAKAWGGNKPMWQLWTVSAPIYIDSSDMAGYEVKGKVYATNSHFYNAGNGETLGNSAELKNCTGSVSAKEKGSIIVTNCKLSSFGAGLGSSVQVVNSSIDNIGTASHNGSYTKCIIGNFDLYLDTIQPNKVVFTDCSFTLPSYRLFRIFAKNKKQANGLTFIRTKLPATMVY
jgi:hypothetical protein